MLAAPDLRTIAAGSGFPAAIAQVFPVSSLLGVFGITLVLFFVVAITARLILGR